MKDINFDSCWAYEKLTERHHYSNAKTSSFHEFMNFLSNDKKGLKFNPKDQNMRMLSKFEPEFSSSRSARSLFASFSFLGDII